MDMRVNCMSIIDALSECTFNLQVSRQHLNVELVSCVFDFIRYLMNASNGKEMLCQVVEQLLLSSGLWITASGKVEISPVTDVYGKL